MANLSTFGVRIFDPWKPTSLQPRSSTSINKIWGFLAVSVAITTQKLTRKKVVVASSRFMADEYCMYRFWIFLPREGCKVIPVMQCHVLKWSLFFQGDLVCCFVSFKLIKRAYLKDFTNVNYLIFLSWYFFSFVRMIKVYAWFPFSCVTRWPNQNKLLRLRYLITKLRKKRKSKMSEYRREALKNKYGGLPSVPKRPGKSNL